MLFLKNYRQMLNDLINRLSINMRKVFAFEKTKN